MDEHTKTPTNVREVGIHIGYIRDDIAELKAIVKEMKEEAVGRIEFEEYKKNNAIRHSAHETNLTTLEVAFNSKLDNLAKKVERRPWVLTTLVSLFTIVITLVVTYVINDLIRGGN